jgi:hypothetical protein
MIPADYLYLIDIETEEPLAIFSIEECQSELEIISLEARVRAEHNVDDPASGLALRDSLDAPLGADVVREVIRRMKRRGG